MVFYMNRLGFLSSDSVILSQPGDYFNFFSGSAIAVSDADPIDMAASSTRPANLTSGISTTGGLLLFSTDAQFLMSTRDVAFGPSTVTDVRRNLELCLSIYCSSDRSWYINLLLF